MGKKGLEQPAGELGQPTQMGRQGEIAVVGRAEFLGCRVGNEERNMNRTTLQGGATQLEMLRHELVAYFRRGREQLRSQWVQEMTAKGFLQGLTEEEVVSESATIYDLCVGCLETGQYDDARSYAQRMAGRRVLRGMTPEQILGGMFILRDVYGLALIEQYHADVPRLVAALAVFQPVVNEILSIIAAVFLEERVRERTAQLEKANEALRESEERFRLAQEAAHVGAFDWNIQTGAYMWTPEMEAIHGLPPGGFARTHASWEALVHPDDRVEAMAQVRQALETNAPTEGEWRVIWPDGSVHWVFGRLQPFRDESGRLLRLIAVNVDISERKRAEEEIRRLNEGLEDRVRERTAQLAAASEALRSSQEKYRSIVDNIGVGIALLSPRMEVLELNRQMRVWFPRIDPTLHTTCYCAFDDPASQVPCPRCPVVKTLQDGQVHEDVTGIPEGGQLCHYRIVSSPLHDAEGNLAAVIEMVEVTTAGARAERQESEI
jgi:PAS domain S-box-containing protein